MIKVNSCCINLFFKDELIGIYMIYILIIDGVKINFKVYCFFFISNCKWVFCCFCLYRNILIKFLFYR